MFLINKIVLTITIVCLIFILIFRRRIPGCIHSFQKFILGFPISDDIQLPPFTQNEVQLLVNGNEIMPAILDLINNSRHSICIQVMLFHPDEAGFQLADHLKQASLRGVKVRLSFDISQSVKGPVYLPYDKPESSERKERMNRLFAEMKSSGIQIQNNPSRITYQIGNLSPEALQIQQTLIKSTCVGLNHTDHRKIFLADNASAIIGGTNIGNEYLYHISPDLDQNMVVAAETRRKESHEESWEKWLDTAVHVEGPAAKLLLREYLNRWEILGGDTDHLIYEEIRSGSKSVQVLSQRPGNEEIAVGYLQLIRNAQRSIYISSPYVSYRPGLEALMDACKRGVEVIFFFPGDLNDVPVSKRIFRSFTSALISAGVKVYESNQRMIHSKVMVVDERWSTVGSFNFDYRSFVHDFEQNLLIDDPLFAREVINRIFSVYMKISTKLETPYPPRLRILDQLILPFS